MKSLSNTDQITGENTLVEIKKQSCYGILRYYDNLLVADVYFLLIKSSSYSKSSPFLPTNIFDMKIMYVKMFPFLSLTYFFSLSCYLCSS